MMLLKTHEYRDNYYGILKPVRCDKCGDNRKLGKSEGSFTVPSLTHLGSVGVVGEANFEAESCLF